MTAELIKGIVVFTTVGAVAIGAMAGIEHFRKEIFGSALDKVKQDRAKG